MVLKAYGAKTIDNVAINDVLSHKTARRDAIANFKILGTQNTSEIISMVSFTFTMRRHVFRLASAPFTAFRLAKFGWVPFADLREKRLATKQNAEFKDGG